MRARRLGFLLLSAGLVVSAPDSPVASERSELLVAKGEVAYHRGLYEEARARFAEAVAADPADAAAHYQLGLALLALERRDEAEGRFERALALRPDLEAARRALALARGEEPPTPEVARPGTPSAPSGGRKRWEIHAATGFQYDSNVTIAPGGQTGEQFGDRDDVGFVLTGGGRYNLLDREDALIRLEYDLYQTLHVALTDFDFRAHHVRGTASHALIPSLLWAGVQGGYHHYTLGEHSYLSEPTVMPFLSLLEGNWGLTQASYRFGYDTYLTQPFHEVRDGPSHAVGLDQSLYDLAGTSYVVMGYQYGSENPVRAGGNPDVSPAQSPTLGNDFELQFHQAYAGVGIPVWWQVAIDLMYLYRYDDYTHPNSFVDFRKARHDSTHYFYASVSRPIIPHVSVALAYFGTIDYSNISLYEYHRNVVSAVLEVTY